jgi:hypothetical protein
MVLSGIPNVDAKKLLQTTFALPSSSFSLYWKEELLRDGPA